MQEEERERRMDFVPEVSAIASENIEVDSDTFALIQAHLNMDLPGIVLRNVSNSPTQQRRTFHCTQSQQPSPRGAHPRPRVAMTEGRALRAHVVSHKPKLGRAHGEGCGDAPETALPGLPGHIDAYRTPRIVLRAPPIGRWLPRPLQQPALKQLVISRAARRLGRRGGGCARVRA